MKDILIIEDTKLYQEKIKSLISEMDYNIEGVFAYGRKALDYIAQNNNQPDLIIIDIMLAGKMDGYEVAKKISSETTIPIIFLTGTEYNVNELSLDNLEVSVYLNKPFNKQELKNNIELVLNKYETYRKLQDSIAEKKLLLENINVQVWYLKDPTIYGVVNKAYADFLGLRKEEIEGKKINEILPKEEAKRCIASNKQVFSAKKQIEKREWVTDKTGDQKLLSITKTPDLDDSGNVKYIVCSAEDITEEYKLTQQLKKNRDYLKYIINTIPDIVMLLDEKGNYLDSWTDNSIDLVVSKKDLIGENIKKFLPEKVVDKFEKYCSQAVQKNEVQRFEYQLEINKHKKYFEARLVALDTNRVNQQNQEILVIIHDITERKEKEKKLKLTQYSVDNAALGILWITPEGKFEYVNDKICDMLNYSREELINKKVSEIDPNFPDEKRDKRWEEIKQSKNNKIETQHITKTGEKIPVQVTSRYLEYDGKAYEFAFVQDITERKRAEEKRKEHKDLLENLSNQVPGALYQYQMFADGNSCFPFASDGIYDVYEVTSEEVMEDASKVFERIHPDDYTAINESIKKSAENLTIWQEEYRVQLPKKGLRWLEGHAQPEKMPDGSVLWHGYLRDITERKKQEEKIKKLSFRDHLTALYNRRYFEEEMERLDNSRRLPISIVVADMDGLKYINDNYGHKIGDEFIKKTGEIFNKCVRKSDIVARVGGDEFSVILPETDYQTAKKLCNRIKNECRKFNKKGVLPERVNISLGAATKNSKKEDLNSVFSKADKNMYEKKRKKKKAGMSKNDREGRSF